MKPLFALFALLLSWSAVHAADAEDISAHETMVHKIVTVHFAATDLSHQLIALKDLIGHDSQADQAFATLTRSAATMMQNSDNAIQHFHDQDALRFAVATLSSQAAVARSSLTRLNTALLPQSLPPEAAALLANLALRIDGILQTLKP